MTMSFKLIPLLAAFAAAPTFAAEPDAHAAHHPDAAAAALNPASPAAKTEIKPASPQRCPMMDAKMADGRTEPRAGASAHDAPKAESAQGGGMAQGKMMDGKVMHCMQTPVVAADPASKPKHDRK